MGSESQLVFTYVSTLVKLLVTLPKAHAQNGVSVSYVDAVFKLEAYKESEIWTSLLLKNMSFKQHSPSLHTPIAAIIDS